MPKQYAPTNGTHFETEFVEALNSKRWGVRRNGYLDQYAKVDVKSEYRDGRKIPCPIEVQVTRDVNNADKLALYIKAQLKRRNGCAKIYVIVHGDVSADDAASQANTMFARDLLRPGVADKLFLLDVLGPKECRWSDIYARSKELKEKKLQKTKSADRQRGEVMHMAKNGAGLVIKGRKRQRFFAFYSEVIDPFLYHRLKQRAIAPGTRVTFLPTTRLSNGVYFLAESVLSA